MVCEHLGRMVCEEQISVVMMQQRPDAIVSELFSSVCAEIRDEVRFSAYPPWSSNLLVAVISLVAPVFRWMFLWAPSEILSCWASLWITPALEDQVLSSTSGNFNFNPGYKVKHHKPLPFMFWELVPENFLQTLCLGWNEQCQKCKYTQRNCSDVIHCDCFYI